MSIFLQTLDFWWWCTCLHNGMFCLCTSISCISGQLCVSDTMLHVITYSKYTLSLFFLFLHLSPDGTLERSHAGTPSGSSWVWKTGEELSWSERVRQPKVIECEQYRLWTLFIYLHFLFIWSIYKLGFINDYYYYYYSAH